MPVNIVVFNDRALCFIELEMKAAGLVNFGTNLQNPMFGAVAAALGLYGQRVDRPDDLAVTNVGRHVFNGHRARA